MKWLAWIMVLINIYFGVYCLLNVLNILQSGKYSTTATLIFAIIFLNMAIGAAYLLLSKHNYTAGFLAGIGPWILSLLFLFLNMLTSDYK